MALIKWQASFNLGIASIDQQHRRLVAMINTLDEGLKGRYNDPVMRKIFIELGDYTASHFDYEEALFAEHGYVDAKEHKQEHQALLEQVIDYQIRVQKGDINVGPELLDFLKRWLTGHILGSDRKYAQFLTECDVK